MTAHRDAEQRAAVHQARSGVARTQPRRRGTRYRLPADGGVRPGAAADVPRRLRLRSGVCHTRAPRLPDPRNGEHRPDDLRLPDRENPRGRGEYAAKRSSTTARAPRVRRPGRPGSAPTANAVASTLALVSARVPYQAVFNATQPAAVVPWGLDQHGLPLSQLVGRPFDEATLLSLAAEIRGRPALGAPPPPVS